MNEKFRERVLAFINNKDYISSLLAPLYFAFYKEADINIFAEDKDINDMVRTVLRLSRTEHSINYETDEFETGADHWRSSLDIWRHIIYYDPKVTIFEVIKSLYDIRDDCGGQYCHDIKRRVFKLRMHPSDTWWYNQIDRDGDYADVLDEYDLLWTDWEDI